MSDDEDNTNFYGTALPELPNGRALKKEFVHQPDV